MIILVYLNILLRFLIKILFTGVVFMGKRTQKDVSSDEADNNTTPTSKKARLGSYNAKDSEYDTTPADEKQSVEPYNITEDLD